MLLFGSGTFLQSIEGEAVVVDPLIELISKDPRHRDIRILRRDEITGRQYSKWSMGFERVTESTLEAIPSLRNFRLTKFHCRLPQHPWRRGRHPTRASSRTTLGPAGPRARCSR